MIKNYLIHFIYVTMIIFILGCAAKQQESLTASEDFHINKAKYDQGKYRKASEGFERFIRVHSGSKFAEKAQFYLADSYYHDRNYLLASTEFRYYIQRFGGGEFAEEAQYKLAMCYFEQSPKSYLDQEMTEIAIREASRFMSKYSESKWYPEMAVIYDECQNKLAKKTYDNGYIYYRSMKHYKAARIYYQEVLDMYRGTEWVDDAQFGIGETYRAEKKWEDALQAYQKVLDFTETDSELAKKATERIDDMNEKIISME